jgi:hypothetical protein
MLEQLGLSTQFAPTLQLMLFVLVAAQFTRRKG